MQPISFVVDYVLSLASYLLTLGLKVGFLDIRAERSFRATARQSFSFNQIFAIGIRTRGW